MKIEEIRALPKRKRIPRLISYYFWNISLGVWLIFLLGSWIWTEFVVPGPKLQMEMINSGIVTEAPQEAAMMARAMPEPAAIMTCAELPAPEAPIAARDMAIRQDITLHCEEGENPIVNPYQLLFSSLQSGKMDLYFWDRDVNITVTLYSSLMDLREVLPTEVLEANRDKLLFSAPILQGGFPFAIMLEDNPWLLENGYYDRCFVGVSSHAKNTEAAAQFLTFLMEG